MKRRILLVVSILLILSGMFILVRIAASTLIPKGKGCLQVTSNTIADVLLDNKPIGQAPLSLCEKTDMITEGTYELKIIPKDKNLESFTTRLRINPGVMTAVERTFLPGAYASSYTLTLEKTNSRDPELFIASIPDAALVSIDGKEVGITALSQKSIPAGEHEIEIQKEGFSKKTVRVRAVPSYKLVLNVILGTEVGSGEALEPTPTLTPSQESTNKSQVIIENTPVGFLRVRENPSTASREITRVNPGESYPFIDENAGWFQIELSDGTRGWISKQYATKK